MIPFRMRVISIKLVFNASVSCNGSRRGRRHVPIKLSNDWKYHKIWQAADRKASSYSYNSFLYHHFFFRFNPYFFLSIYHQFCCCRCCWCIQLNLRTFLSFRMYKKRTSWSNQLRNRTSKARWSTSFSGYAGMDVARSFCRWQRWADGVMARSSGRIGCQQSQQLKWDRKMLCWFFVFNGMTQWERLLISGVSCATTSDPIARKSVGTGGSGTVFDQCASGNVVLAHPIERTSKCNRPTYTDRVSLLLIIQLTNVQN